MGIISFMHLNKPNKGGKGVQKSVEKNTDIETMKLVELKEYALEIGCGDLAEIKNVAQAKKMIKDFLIAQQENESKTDEQEGASSNPADEADADETQDEVEKE